MLYINIKMEIQLTKRANIKMHEIHNTMNDNNNEEDGRFGLFDANAWLHLY